MKSQHLFLLVIAFVIGCVSSGTDQFVPETMNTVVEISPDLVLPQDDGLSVPTSQGSDEASEAVEINESIQCPSEGFDPEKLDTIIRALSDHSNRDRFILWESTPGVVGEPDNVQVVYQYQGVRYTLWYISSEMKNVVYMGETYPIITGGLISVWERPVGTTSEVDEDTYTDRLFTGCVNFGLGDRSRYGDGLHQMHWNNEPSENQGIEYHADWQAKYNQALTGLGARLGII